VDAHLNLHVAASVAAGWKMGLIDIFEKFIFLISDIGMTV
jgi:hypothetical protein